MLSVTIPNISPSQNTPVLPNMRRIVTRPSGASCSRRNSAKLSLATILHPRSGKVRHDIRDEEFASLDVVPTVALDQQVDAGVPVLPHQIDGLGHGAGKAAQRCEGRLPLALRRHRGRVAGKEPALDMGLFDRVIVATHRVAMAAQHGQLVSCLRDVATDQIAGVGQASDRAQRHLFATAGDHHRRTRLLYWLRLEDRVLDMEIPAVESRPRLGPQLQDQLDRFLHLPDSRRRPRWERPAILLVFILEKAGADAERQSSPADQIDARRDLGEMRRIAITDRRDQGCQTDAARDSSQPRQDDPAFQERLVRRAHEGGLDHVVLDREPDEAVIFRPLRLRLRRLERFGRIGTVDPGGVVNTELHDYWASPRAAWRQYVCTWLADLRLGRRRRVTAFCCHRGRACPYSWCTTDAPRSPAP